MEGIELLQVCPTKEPIRWEVRQKATKKNTKHHASS